MDAQNALNSMDTGIGGRISTTKKKKKNQNGVGSFEANSNKGFENINTSSGKTTIAAIEPIFSIARQ